MKDQKLVDELRNGSDKLWEKVYFTYKEEFILFIRAAYSVDENDLEDLYSMTMITFYENIHKNKIKPLTSSLKTYLLGIGKNKTRSWLRNRKKAKDIKEWIILNHLDEVSDEAKDVNLKNQLSNILDVLPEIGGKCEEILDLYYFEELSIKEISEQLGYSSINAAKTAKYKCMEKIRKILRGDDKSKTR